uniref:Reverse transcriptase domain-containing protein n=1 Tax=Romanomermis culicivorax TaxID=13658 RepID=A0A915I4P1_ROMCU
MDNNLLPAKRLHGGIRKGIVDLIWWKTTVRTTHLIRPMDSGLYPMVRKQIQYYRELGTTKACPECRPSKFRQGVSVMGRLWGGVKKMNIHLLTALFVGHTFLASIRTNDEKSENNLLPAKRQSVYRERLINWIWGKTTPAIPVLRPFVPGLHTMDLPMIPNHRMGTSTLCPSCNPSRLFQRGVSVMGRLWGGWNDERWVRGKYRAKMWKKHCSKSQGKSWATWLAKLGANCGSAHQDQKHEQRAVLCTSSLQMGVERFVSTLANFHNLEINYVANRVIPEKIRRRFGRVTSKSYIREYFRRKNPFWKYFWKDGKKFLRELKHKYKKILVQHQILKAHMYPDLPLTLVFCRVIFASIEGTSNGGKIEHNLLPAERPRAVGRMRPREIMRRFRRIRTTPTEPTEPTETPSWRGIIFIRGPQVQSGVSDADYRQSSYCSACLNTTEDRTLKQVECIPWMWKKALVILILKKADQSSTNDQKSIHEDHSNETTETLEQTSREEQVGFWLQPDFIDQILTLCQFTEQWIRCSQQTVILFIDCKSAFDCIHWPAYASKLGNFCLSFCFLSDMQENKP